MLLLAPHPIAAIEPSAAALLTPSPREIWAATGRSPVLPVDLGAPRRVAWIVLAFVNVVAGVSYAIDTGTGFDGPWTPIPGGGGLQAESADTGQHSRHMLIRLPEVTTRYLRLRFDTPPPIAFLTAACVLIGTPFWCPHEKGGGRGILDTGTREDLSDGGWAGEEGVRLRTLGWRFAGLTDDQVDQLEDIALDRGRRGPLVAFEHRTMAPLTEAYASRRMIYGVFDKFEAFERLDPRDSRWSFSMIERR